MQELAISAPNDLTARPRLSPLAVVYGGLGLIPFWLPLAAAAFPRFRIFAEATQMLYAGLILAFLAGARFRSGAENAATTSLSMVGPVFSLAVLAIPGPPESLRALLLAAGLGLQGFWDVTRPHPPIGYRRLRIALTAGGSLSLILGAWALR